MTVQNWDELARLDQALALNQQVIVSGNVHDLFLTEQGVVEVEELLVSRLLRRGASLVLTLSGNEPIRLSPADQDPSARLGALLSFIQQETGKEVDGAPVLSSGQPIPLGAMAPALATVAQLLQVATTPIAALVLGCEWLVSSENADLDRDRECALQMRRLATLAAPDVSGGVGNISVLVFGRGTSVPVELLPGDPRVRHVVLPLPSKPRRMSWLETNVSEFARAPGKQPLEHQADLLDEVASLTEGLKLRELRLLARLSREEGIPLGRATELLRKYKHGVARSAWSDVSVEKVKRAPIELRKKVKGQDPAVDHVASVLTKACAGVAGAARDNPGRPQGVLFFVGPSGVGKTYLAKRLAALLFGEEEAFLRFDMSEYSQEHNEARLIGAPPGYRGFDEGGQLTNAVRRQPYSVLLFDEIEKAHQRILDKFLQILEDGRLTDGRGETVYFSDSVIIFTSNEGTSSTDPVENTRLKAEIERIRALEIGPGRYAEVRAHFVREVERYFTQQLARPELLTRIGLDNIIVFDYLDDPAVRRAILGKSIAGLKAWITERYPQVDLQIATEVEACLLDQLAEKDEVNGRAIADVLERQVSDKIASRLLDQQEGTLRIDQHPNPEAVCRARWVDR